MKPEFTDEENYLIAYYRDESISSASRSIALDATRVLVAVGFVIFAVISEDAAWGLVAFGILLFGEARSMIGHGKYTRNFRSILVKYDDAVKEGDVNDVKD